TATWDGTVTMNSNRTGILVDTGSTFIIGNNTLGLTVTNNGLVNGNPFNKLGGGTLSLAGTVNNALGGGNIVWQGELDLKKINNAVAMPSSLTVGDIVGGPNADILRIGTDPLATNQQIVAGINNLTLQGGALFDLNGHLQNFSLGGTSLTLNIGPSGSPNVTT